MSALKSLLIAAAVLAVGARVWQSHESAVNDRELQALADGNGFVPVEMPDGAPRDTVLILAPLNCPSVGAKRAEALAGRLRELGIPNIRTSQYAVAGLTPDRRAGVDHAVAIMKGQVPAVMINGRAKANPTADEVAGEFRND
jgi:hypothetical protein